MFEYLLKVTACMTLFMVFYRLFLERENMHRFKRFFLLGSLVASFVIPKVVFVEYIDVPASGWAPQQLAEQSEATLTDVVTVSDTKGINWSSVLWNIYLMGVVLFGFRFVRHLFQMLRRIRKNPKLKLKKYTQVLLNVKMPPHTFFGYIFLNKTELDNNKIPKEVLLHEEAHAKQWHSLDVVFIELLQAVFWFNPLLIFFKKSIKLNHEFLADGAVLDTHVATEQYQNILAAFLTKHTAEKYGAIHMANAINYASIKKRFTIMRKRTSKKIAIMKSILLFAFTITLLFGFSTTKELTKTVETSDPHLNYTARSLSVELLKDGFYTVEGVLATKENFIEVINQFNQDITPEIRNRILNIHLSSSSEISNNEVWFIYDSFQNYGFYRIVAPNQEIISEKGNTPFAVNNELFQKSEGLNTMEFDSKSSNTQEGASKEQLEEYNELAKKYNEMPKSNMRVSMKEVERMKYIYYLMTDEQKEEAEPFPNFPPPPSANFRSPADVRQVPSPPSAPQPPSKSTIHEHAPSKIDSIVKTQDSNDWPNININASAKPIRVPAAPGVPLKPKNQLDHIIDMAKKEAEFYFEGKAISSDKAIELLKKNKKLNIETITKDAEKPQVKISKKAITIGKVDEKSNNLLEYAKLLETKGANFYLDGEEITASLAFYIIEKKDFEKVETLPWVNQTPEVKIYSKA